MDWAEENSLKIIREAISGQVEEFPPDTDWGVLEKELNNKNERPGDILPAMWEKAFPEVRRA